MEKLEVEVNRTKQRGYVLTFLYSTSTKSVGVVVVTEDGHFHLFSLWELRVLPFTENGCDIVRWPEMQSSHDRGAGEGGAMTALRCGPEHIWVFGGVGPIPDDWPCACGSQRYISVATTLAALHAENERLRGENNKLQLVLRDMFTDRHASRSHHRGFFEDCEKALCVAARTFLYPAEKETP